MSPNSRRQFAVTVVVGLAAAGLALYAASRTWVVEEGFRPEPLPPLGIERSGGSLVPALPAFALVGLAGVGALLATRGRLRLVVAIILMAAGLGVFIAAFTGFSRYDDAGLWAVLAMLSGLVLGGVGTTALRHSGQWPAMGARYERSAGHERSAGYGRSGGAASDPDARPTGGGATELWDAIDRGDDPTRDAGTGDRPGSTG